MHPMREVAGLFLKLGTIAFGGPAAHIALMQHEVVERRQWLDRQHFLDLLGATNLIPGPNSTELAIHVGYHRAGWRGLLVAGACFILPAMLMVWGLAILYAQYQAVPQLGWLLYGIKPVILAVVIQALWGLSRSAVKGWVTGVCGAVVAVLAFVGVDQILLLLLAGVGVLLVQRLRGSGGALPGAAGALAPVLLPLAGAPADMPMWGRVFWVFLKIGSVLYGSGYVLLAFLQRELVEKTHWLTSQQLLDAVAIGQFTPGPVFTTATFVGYLLSGHAGAVAATVGIFLPAFILVAAINPFVPRLRRSPVASAFLDGVNVASMALMAVVTWELGVAAVTDWLTVLLALTAFRLLYRYKTNSAWLVVGGGAIGWVSHLFT